MQKAYYGEMLQDQTQVTQVQCWYHSTNTVK